MIFKKNVEETLKIWSKEYKKGLFSYMILLILKERIMYGFEINNKFIEITKGKISFQESGIYHILKKLSQKGFVTMHSRKSDKGPKRKYYKITASGNQLLEIFTKNYILPFTNLIKEIVRNSFSF